MSRVWTKQEIYKKFKPAFLLTNRFSNHMERVMSSFRLPKELVGYPEICFFFGTKACRHLRAVDILCRNGFPSETMGLIRSLCHIWIDIQWIKIDPVVRSERYTTYYRITQWKHFKGSPRREKYRSDYEIALRLHPKSSRRFGWSGKNLYDRAVDVDMSRPKRERFAVKHYKSVYGPTSEHEHTDPFDAVWYFKDEDIKARRADLGRSVRAIPRLLYTANGYCSDILKYCDDVCHFGIAKMLKRSSSKFNKWRKENYLDYGEE